MPPPLDELLRPSRLGEADPYFDDFTVESLPVCAAEDSPISERRRILVSEDSGEVDFPTAGDVAAETTFLNIDDSDYRRILTVTGGFVYARTATGSSGREIPLGPGIAHLCREGSADEAGRYEVYISDNVIANNAPGNPPALRRVPMPLAFDEIAAIVRSLRRPDGSAFRLASDRYLVDPADPTQLSIMPDASEVEDMARMVEADNSPIPEARRAPIAAALREMMSRERLQEDSMREASAMRTEMREMQWLMLAATAGLTVYSTLLATGKAGAINYAAAFPFRAVGTPLFEGAINLFNAARGRPVSWRWTENFYNEIRDRVRYRSIPTLLRIGTNLTELARRGEIRPVADGTTASVAQMIENTILSRYNTMSVLVEGPPGWGKEVLMRELARRNPNIVFIQVSPNGMMGGTMYRGQLEERLTDIPREIARARANGQMVVLDIDEFHEALSAGRSMESTTSLLEHWKGELARGDMRAIGFSTPRELLKARYIAGFYNDPASRARLSPEFRAEVERFEREGVRQNIELRPLLNRFQPVILPARPVEDIVDILEDKIEERRTGDGFRIEADADTLSRIAELSESPMASEGHIPRTALAIFNGLIDANASGDAASVSLTREMVDAYVRTTYPEIAQRFSLIEAPVAAPVVETPRPATAATVPASPWMEVMTYNVNDATVEAALRRADPALADFYRAQISNEVAPVTTVSELVSRIALVDPTIPSAAVSALSAEGRPMTEMSERLVFELISRTAEARGAWSMTDVTARPAMVSRFENEVREGAGVERRGGSLAETDAARREAEERARRESRSGRP